MAALRLLRPTKHVELAGARVRRRRPKSCVCDSRRAPPLGLGAEAAQPWTAAPSSGPRQQAVDHTENPVALASKAVGDTLGTLRQKLPSCEGRRCSKELVRVQAG
jgi:hypothetical protein